MKINKKEADLFAEFVLKCDLVDVPCKGKKILGLVVTEILKVGLIAFFFLISWWIDGTRRFNSLAIRISRIIVLFGSSRIISIGGRNRLTSTMNGFLLIPLSLFWNKSGISWMFEGEVILS